MTIQNKSMFISVQMSYNTKDKKDKLNKELIIDAILHEAGQLICNLAHDEGIETTHYKFGKWNIEIVK